ncbi:MULTISPECIES: polysaccharide biosynthesis/export family protein [unclassified Sphingomonas]|uniref:polysaccharide biosynthesis/export family protein n=1 Tax=unclassified Sphingomonas TaxID=196159 RepID=UPI000ACE44BF|nr:MULTISPECIES: polysaccharide biosynthesis/export family protein [unclassified Sphingomonas]TCP65969.1 polysaccharide export outer membrane protein [Sphingomonas sp. PP-CE-1G-424]
MRVMHSARVVRPGLALLVMTAMSACATLPRNGPTGSQITHDATKANDIGYQLVDIAPGNIAALSTVDVPSGALATLAADGFVDTLGPGDVLSVEIYEVGVSLFGGRASIAGGGGMAGGDAPSASGQALGQGGLTVDRNGNITIPYVGTIQVTGLTLAQVQQRILAGLRGKSQSPQVIVSLRSNVANTVVVMGAVTTPRRVPLTLARERLLDVIADTGGISRAAQSGSSTATGTGTQDSIVRFTRNGRTVEQPLDSIVSGSPDDLVLLGGDRIELIRQPRTFTVFGAIDRISQVPFESRTLTLAEALARAGGPNDGRADPRSVFVFRLPAGAAALEAKQPGAAPATVRPIIYRIDMLRAQNYFLAQQFAMRDKDVVYIANASANQPLKLVQALGQLFSPVIAVQNATR